MFLKIENVLVKYLIIDQTIYSKQMDEKFLNHADNHY